MGKGLMGNGLRAEGKVCPPLPLALLLFKLLNTIRIGL